MRSQNSRPLLKQLSHIIKLRNVFNPERLSSLFEEETREVLEDVRLECARFGMVKSVKIVKHTNNYIVTTGVSDAVNNDDNGGHWKSSRSDEGVELETLDGFINNEVMEYFYLIWIIFLFRRTIDFCLCLSMWTVDWFLNLDCEFWFMFVNV